MQLYEYERDSRHYAEIPDPELWIYREQTIALLRRYFRLSVEAGRLPAFLGREFFRTRIKSERTYAFEDVVIFVHDVERSLEQLDIFSQQLPGLGRVAGFFTGRSRSDPGLHTAEGGTASAAGGGQIGEDFSGAGDVVELGGGACAGAYEMQWCCTPDPSRLKAIQDDAR